MTAVLVVESYFGSTRHLAEIVAATLHASGIASSVVDVDEAPASLPDDTELLVVGAPTHDLGLSTPESRQAATNRSMRGPARTGVREWASALALPEHPPLVAVFDTRMGDPWLAGSAAAQASVLLSGRGFPVSPARITFRVIDVAGPLRVGEVERARHWAADLAARLEHRLRTHH